MFARLLILTVLLLTDLYVFQSLKVLFGRRLQRLKKYAVFSFLLTTAASLTVLLFVTLTDRYHWSRFLSYAFSMVVIVYLSKIILVVFLVADDLIILIRKGVALIKRKFVSPPLPAQSSPESPKITRSEFLLQAGTVISLLPFASLVYGMINGVSDFKVWNIKIPLPNLPASFNGLKIVQISDIHTGSFSSPEPLKRAAGLVSSQRPDVIFFTGDLVNERSEEAISCMDVLREIKAPMGVYSTLGNHDYGDYAHWESDAAKKENFELIKTIHKEAGWNLLLNEHTILKRGNDKIAVIGVENWSAFLRFPKYGNMEKAIRGMEHVPVKILLSHDPSHWDAEVNKKYNDIDLMLAGHTHGMQFGIENKWLKWSPVEYIYDQWAGLYKKANQYLYVNRGLGFLGYPGRVGIMPEITVIELVKT